MAEFFRHVIEFDRRMLALAARYAHWLHRVSLGVLFIWFGLLKPLGHATTTSILAQAVYWGDPQTMVLLLGWWEVAIGVCLIFRPLVRLAIALLVLRLPGILLAFVLQPDACFYSFPFAPTPEGQYLIKDLVIFFASLAIVGMVHGEQRPGHYH